MTLNEYNIQNALHDILVKQTKECVPNYTPGDWWECDLWHVSKAGFAVEHEIKITRSDFKSDVEKRVFCRVKQDWVTKHELLHSGSARGPKNFWYVVPQCMITADEIPEFAGLKEAYVYRNRVRFQVVKNAPNLHKYKVDDKIREHAKSVFYYRYWNLRKKIEK
jgi:hypothetical protein